MNSKTYRTIRAAILGVLFCSITPLYAVTPWLHTEGNLIKDPGGNTVVLRGVDLIDLATQEVSRGGANAMIDRLTNTSNTEGNSPGWYTKIVRIAIVPKDASDGTWPMEFDPNNLNDPNNTALYNLLRSVVDHCKEKDIYAIIDWHYVANTYDHVASTSAFWTYMAPKFANDSHVLFELFNEPINDLNGDWIFNNNDVADWLSVRTNMQAWINIVRTYAPNNLILVAGPYYSQAIGPAATYPLTADNIVIVSHIYPAHWLDLYWGDSYKDQIDACLGYYPVFMSEWGFSVDSSSSGLQGTITNYGQPLTDFRDARNISNTAWVASYDWEPPMFYSNWTLRVGEGQMGGFTKDTLYLRRNDNQPSEGDSTAPAAPTGVNTMQLDKKVRVYWNDNSEADLYGYDINRSTIQGGPYSKISHVRSKDYYYDDANISGNTTYYYVVTAVDTSFNSSDYSDEVSITTPPDTTPPASPTGLMATAGKGKVRLNWTDNNDVDINGYNIYRSLTSGSGYARINGSLLKTSDYNDYNVINSTPYYYVVTAVDTSSNESGYSNQASATPDANAPNIYNFADVKKSNAEYNAYGCDVDVFPFGGNSLNRNTMVEASDVNYAGISANDTSEWAPVNPGAGDETFLWLEMKINESPSDISRIDLTFNGYTTGSGGVPHRIYVMKADADWTQDTSWVQVGSDQDIWPGTYTTMTCSITSGISNYINGAGTIVWGVYETLSAQVTHINYVEMAVYYSSNNPPTVSITSLSNGDVFYAGGDIVINANASDADGSVTKVEFFEGASKLGEDTDAPYSYTWSNVPLGSYTLTAKATDNADNTTTSSEVNVIVISEGTGAALSEWWTGIPGADVNDLTSNVNYPDNPTGRELLTKLEGPIDWNDNYGDRIRGYLHPITSGNYTFWITSENSSELWLSTDAEPANKTLIASVIGSGTQQSSLVSLVSGNKYYIEVLHKADVGNDNVAVAWQGPGITQQVIDGLYLSPCCLKFADFAGLAGQWDRNDCNTGNDWCNGFDFNRNGLVSIVDLKAFAESWLLGTD